MIKLRDLIYGGAEKGLFLCEIETGREVLALLILKFSKNSSQASLTFMLYFFSNPLKKYIFWGVAKILIALRNVKTKYL